MAYVYEHWRFDKGEKPICFYVGISNNNDTKYLRLNRIHGRNSIWTNIVNKVGYFSSSIAIDNITMEEALEEEKKRIEQYGRLDIGTGTLANLTDGGEGTYGIFVTEQQRNMRSLRMKGENNICFGLTGSLHPMYGKSINKGKVMPEELKKRVSLKVKETWTEERRKSESERMKALWKDEEFRNSMLIKYKESITPEFRLKKSLQNSGGGNPRAKIVLDFDTGIFYDCAKDAAKAKGYVLTTLRNMLNGTNPNKTRLRYV